jgi:hypothetical protein
MRDCPNAAGQSRAPAAWSTGAFLLLIAATGCKHDLPQQALIVAEKPSTLSTSATTTDILDQRYPAGSRIIVAGLGPSASPAQVLSKGLAAAGDIVASPRGDRIFFAGKATRAAHWQIYEANPGASPRQLTFMAGGAMNPALLPTGEIVFSSPVPAAGQSGSQQEPPALYSQAPGGPPQRLTFGGVSATDPTVLQDGRILFVSARPGCYGSAPDLALFTINNDGTELRAFAIDHDGSSFIRRPRETADSRLVFLAGAADIPDQLRAETVRKARPFATRSPAPWPNAARCTSVEPEGDAALVCSLTLGAGTAAGTAAGVYRIALDDRAAAQLLYSERDWDCVEAVSLSSRPAPMGHMTAIQPEKKIGTLLCLNANLTRSGSNAVVQATKATRVRILQGRTNAAPQALGEVPVQDDGSFMVEAPANAPLGLQTLDASGNVIQTLPPFLWVRPGENRSCVGCHEPAFRSPVNSRPKAVMAPPTPLEASALPKTGPESNSQGSIREARLRP